jgi:hypothetical protein
MHFSTGTSVSRGTSSRLDTGNDRWSPARESTTQLEEQFFNILRDAIIRAERNVTNTSRSTTRGTRIPVRSVNSGTNTINTDDNINPASP